jgi:hypothetical protein
VATASRGAVAGLCVPYTESWADALPPQRLGVLSTFLLLGGSALQSLQHVVALLNVHVR